MRHRNFGPRNCCRALARKITRVLDVVDDFAEWRLVLEGVLDDLAQPVARRVADVWLRFARVLRGPLRSLKIRDSNHVAVGDFNQDHHAIFQDTSALVGRGLVN